MSETTSDKFLNGRVTIRQPKHGFRAGLDAVMLAAAVPALAQDTALELGSGNGAASLCLAARVSDLKIVGVDVDEELVELANGNAKSNALDGRVEFAEGDALALPAWLRREFTHVFCNPPFRGSHLPASKDSARARAMRDEDKLGQWMTEGLRRAAPKGTLTMIVAADRLRDLLARAPEHGVTVFPLWPHGVEPAKRVIVQVRKDSRAQSVILPGLVLHEDNGSYTREADQVLRGETALKLSTR